ncbi:hypothetical protein [Spiroplasma ixodetis]|uniref:Uncharacterized protein n=1 Tax=Spiroplasma ixodetis TaxID=2141 RepID=A0ABM8JNT8_9MOLU
MLNNNHQICLLETELKQEPNNEKIKNKIKNLIEEIEKLTDEKIKLLITKTKKKKKR